MGRFQEQFRNLAGEKFPSQAEFDGLVIANANDPSKQFDRGFEILFGENMGSRKEKESVIENWDELGIHLPEIRATIFRVMKEVGLFKDPELKYLLCSSIIRSGVNWAAVIISGEVLEKQLPASEAQLIFYLADNAGEMKNKRPIDFFREDKLYNKMDSRVNAFYDSPVGLELRRLGVLEWLCEAKPGKGARFGDQFRPIFKEEIGSELYQSYRADEMGFIEKQYQEFLKTG